MEYNVPQGSNAVIEVAHRDPDARVRGQVLEQDRRSVAVGQRDPPVRVLVHRPRQVLRPAFAHRLGLVNELADYLLFANEAPPLSPLKHF